jgi:PIN domain nuclease of toxin-antitoxin system
LQVLLDTHALLWWLMDHPSLPASIHQVLAQKSNRIYVSAASAWEISTKARLGKLDGAADLVRDFPGYLEREQFLSFPITVEHAARAGMLPGHHRDPFDRMLAAQAQAENMPIVSSDPAFDAFGVQRLW